MPDKTFDEISRWLFQMVKPNENTKCFKCKRELIGYDVRGYEHDGGWHTKRGWQWLYIECPKCGYQTSFAKMHIPHNIDFAKLKGK